MMCSHADALNVVIRHTTRACVVVLRGKGIVEKILTLLVMDAGTVVLLSVMCGI